MPFTTTTYNSTNTNSTFASIAASRPQASSFKASSATLAADNKTILISSHILTELAEMCDRVGILEQGRLLATGTVDEIRKGMSRGREVRVRISGPTDDAMQLLGTQEAVDDLTCDGPWIHFSLRGAEKEQIEVLRTLCDARIDVLEYSSREESLEDVFLHITQGRVQ